MSPVLLSTSQVLTVRHSASWALLAMSAGAVNAGAFIACERFVTHVTGTVTQLGVDSGMWELTVESLTLLIAFILGAMASVFAIQGRLARGRRPLHAVPLFAVAGLLLLAGVGGHVGAFGAMGGTETGFGLMCLLAFAMGLQNASVATSTASLVRTTHLTGPATDLGVHLSMAWVSNSAQERTQMLRLAALRALKLAAFGFGAMLMVPVARNLGYLSFGLPALMVLLATVNTFLPSAHEDSSAVGAH
ncbi:MAG TPA: YoaK family protein [Polyangiales bacterium]|nr:YoaK family protein [Polyangiales bacterium]